MRNFRRLYIKLKSLDLSSEYTFWVGLGAIILSLLVSFITFLKLLANLTPLLLSLVVSLVVFYVFSEVYSFIALIALKYILRNQNKL